ncbi:MAG: valine--pyruvate transaminase [Spirochaetes bacterium]|nr:valine--pyruvate transaminase [Spirochaetota bacterium]
MELSDFGKKFTVKSGILELMDDMGKALSSADNICMLGGGNPAIIPEITDLWHRRFEEIVSDRSSFDKIIGEYDPPSGNINFIEKTVNFFRNKYGWNITEKNIAVTNGSQNAFFFLFNILAGKFQGNVIKKILFPLTPEYIGYADQGIENSMFTSQKPVISFLPECLFKYSINFSNLNIGNDIAAVCVSRPTNPTGNVITNDELSKLDEICRNKNIPLIIDNAYGDPFPSILFEECVPIWNENIILSMSLSKIGLPSLRTGFIIANEKIIEAVSSVNAIISLANSKMGQFITAPLIQDGTLYQISREIIRPFYKKKSDAAIEYLTHRLKNKIEFYIHKSEGSIFLWLWFKNLKITTRELYLKLKENGVIIVPGEFFFPGLDDNWKHKHECIRINYSSENTEIGLDIICKTILEI